MNYSKLKLSFLLLLLMTIVQFLTSLLVLHNLILTLLSLTATIVCILGFIYINIKTK